MHPEIMTRNGLRVVDIVNGVCQNAQAREDEVQITAGDTILEDNIIISRDDCVAHPGPERAAQHYLHMENGMLEQGAAQP